MLGINIKTIWRDVSEDQKTFLKRSVMAIIGWIILDSIVSIDDYLTNFVTYGAKFVTNLITTCHTQVEILPFHTNNIIINKIYLIGCHTKIGISHICNGKAIIYLYTAFIIATTGYSQSKRIVYSITGIILISAANIIRIAGLFLIKKDAPAWFDIAHKNIFQFLMYIIVFTLWMFYLQKGPSKPLS